VIAIIFEVQPKPERYREYLDIAASLKDDLEKIDGFISIERFESIYQKGKILSLSLWRDEEAVRAWRLYPAHRDAQMKGRFEVFQDYRLRVAEVIRDYGMFDREQAPQQLPNVLPPG
jgi:heme-degrading monooxygenase HmoA